MAHFAKVTLHNMRVVNVIVAEQDYIDSISGEPNIEYVQTSYNTINGEHQLGGTPLRGNYAAIGYIWDPDRDAFYPEKPHASWTLNETTFRWEAPTAVPDDATKQYSWNEETQTWDEVS
jgi:hypothetical protein